MDSTCFLVFMRMRVFRPVVQLRLVYKLEVYVSFTLTVYLKLIYTNESLADHEPQDAATFMSWNIDALKCIFPL